MDDFRSASYFVRGLLMDVCRPLLLSLLLSIACGFLICGLFFGYGSVVADGVSAQLDSPGYSCIVYAPGGGHIDGVLGSGNVHRGEVLGRTIGGDSMGILSPCDGYFTPSIGSGGVVSSHMVLGRVMNGGNRLIRLPIKDKKNIEATWAHVRVFYGNRQWILADMVSNDGHVAVFRLQQSVFLSFMHGSISVRLFPVLRVHDVLDYLLSPLLHRL